MQINLEHFENPHKIDILLFTEITNSSDIFGALKKGDLDMSLINPKLVRKKKNQSSLSYIHPLY